MLRAIQFEIPPDGPQTIQRITGAVLLEMYTTECNSHKQFHRKNSKTARTASDSFHSQICSNLNNFLNLVLPDSVLLYSVACVNAHSQCVKVRLHYATRQNVTSLWEKSCSEYATKLIISKLKKNFLSIIFQFTKTVKRETHTHHMPCQKLYLTTVDGKYWCNKPLMRPTFCQSNFHACGILQYATACRNHAKAAPHWHLHYFQHLQRCKATFCYILLHGIVWTRLKMPDHNTLLRQIGKLDLSETCLSHFWAIKKQIW